MFNYSKHSCLKSVLKMDQIAPFRGVLNENIWNHYLASFWEENLIYIFYLLHSILFSTSAGKREEIDLNIMGGQWEWSSKTLLLLKSLNKKLSWYFKSILLFVPAPCCAASSKFTAGKAPAVNLLGQVVLCFQPFRELLFNIHNVQMTLLANIQTDFLWRNTLSIKGLTPAVFTNSASFHLMLQGRDYCKQKLFSSV